MSKRIPLKVWRAEYNDHLEYEMGELCRMQKTLDAFGNFYNKHKVILESVCAGGWIWAQKIYSFENDLELYTISSYRLFCAPQGFKILTPKQLAAIFGRDAWIRHSNSQACGSIDWSKRVGDVNLIIK